MSKPYSTYRICVNYEDEVEVEWTDSETKSQRKLKRALNYNSRIVNNSEAANLLEAASAGSLSDRASTRQLGEILFEALLDDVLMFNFLDVYQNVKQQGGYLRVELDIDESRVPAIAAIPWEFLCLPEKAGQGSIWMAADPNIAFSRRRSLYGMPKSLKLAEDEKLKIAVVVSAPSEPGLGKVEFEPVQKILEKLEKDHSDKIQVLPIVNPATVQEINKVLDEQPHIFHFIGHGQLTKKNGVEKSQIALVDELFGGADWKDADLFASLFTRPLGVVLMQSCEGARRSDSMALVDVAAKIGQQNVPVVVAMQYEVTNLTAGRFAVKFYECLAKGLPVDIAAQEGRYAVAWNKEFQGRDFATPVIFSRIKDGYLFQRPDDKGTKQSHLTLPTELKDQEISNNPVEIRREIMGESLFIFENVFSDVLQDGIPSLREDIKDFLGGEFLNQVSQRGSNASSSYREYIEELLHTGNLNSFLKNSLEKRVYRNTNNTEEAIARKEDIEKAQQLLVRLTEQLRKIEKARRERR